MEAYVQMMGDLTVELDKKFKLLIHTYFNIFVSTMLIFISTEYAKDLALCIFILSIYNAHQKIQLYDKLHLRHFCSLVLFVAFLFHINFNFPILFIAMSTIILHYWCKLQSLNSPRDRNLNRDLFRANGNAVNEIIDLAGLNNPHPPPVANLDILNNAADLAGPLPPGNLGQVLNNIG